jgi:hypothetical protein
MTILETACSKYNMGLELVSSCLIGLLMSALAQQNGLSFRQIFLSYAFHGKIF